MIDLKNLLIYGGLSRDDYYRIRPLVHAENGFLLKVCSVTAMTAFIFGAINALSNDQTSMVITYLIGIGAVLLMMIVPLLVNKKFPSLTTEMLPVAFLVIMMTIGIHLAITQSENRTTLFLPIMAFASTLFCIRIVYLLILLVSSELTYLILIIPLQSGFTLQVDVINTLVICFVSCCVGTMLIRMRYNKHAIDYKNKILLERDSLTALYNRRCYDQQLNEIVKRAEPVTLFAFDVNGLKTTNDNLGHAAGDELIIGAAACIKNTFGKYGRVFRIGGDEFAAVVYGEHDVAELKDEFRRCVKAWHGELINELNVSCGSATVKSDFANKLTTALHEADMEMYDDKRRYYDTLRFRNIK